MTLAVAGCKAVVGILKVTVGIWKSCGFFALSPW